MDILSAWKTDVRLTNDSADSWQPQIAIDSKNNIHVVWSDMRTGKAEVFYKKYDGKNWTEDIRLDYNENGASAFPAITIDEQDCIHVTFADNRRTDYRDEIYYTKNNGGGWTEPERITVDSGFIGGGWGPQSGLNIVTNPSGTKIYIFWAGARDYDSYNNGHDIFYTYYDGTSWSPVQDDLENTHPDCCSHYQNVVMDTFETLHLVYNSLEPAGGGYSYFNITYRSFYQNWSEPLNLGEGARPSIAVDPQNNLHLVYGGDLGSDVELYYASLYNNGSVRIDPKRITTVQNDEPLFQDVACDGQSNVHIVWQMYEDLSIWYVKLDNMGNILINATYLSEGASPNIDRLENPNIVFDSLNRANIVFGDDRNGNLEIYYKGTYAQDLSISNEDMSFSNPYPEPNETIWINASVHNNGEILTNASVKFYDDIVDDENLLGSYDVSVPVNSTQNASVIWNATAGNHTIWVVLNCTNVIAEANVTNNTASKNLLVKSQHPPNVVIDSPENLDVYLDTDSIYFDAGNSSDLDNDTLSFYWVSNISGYIENTSQFHASLPIGYHLITLWVDDNSGHNVSATVNVTVKENLPPEIKDYNPKTNVTIMEIQNQTFTITAEDPNNRTLTYMWYLNDTPLAGENNSSYTFIPENNYSGDYLIKVIVSDGYFSKNYTWTVTVVNVEQLQNMIEDLEDQLNQTMVNNTELQNQLEDIRTSLNSIWNQLNQSLTNNTELENQILMLNQNITSMQNQINQLIQEKEELKDERNQAVKDKEDLEQFVLLTEIISLVIGIFIGFFVLYVFRKKLLK
ncbi:MAG: hypothetical protein KJ886_00865 [Candidatus Thermoplasmatota archaeon]|nr:hypothetical protein [Candidatus Thermoplasmatota archaeon]